MAQSAHSFQPAVARRRLHHDVVIDRGKISSAKRKLPRGFGRASGTTSSMDKVQAEAKGRNIELLILPTADALEETKRKPGATNAILRVAC